LVAALSLWLASVIDVQGRTRTAPLVGYVYAGSQASTAGVQVGDKIVSVQGLPCGYFGDKSSRPLLRHRAKGAPDNVPVSVLRGDTQVDIDWPLVAKDEWGWLGNGVEAQDSWTIDAVSPDCAEVLRPGDVIEQASWAEHVIRRDEVTSPRIIEWLFQQARFDPVMLRVKRGNTHYDLSVHGTGGAVFDPEQILDLEPRLVDVVRGSVTWQAGFRPGDLVRKIDDTEIETHRQLIDSLRACLYRPARVTVQRETGLVKLTVPSAAAIRDYANWGLTSSDWFQSLKGLAVAGIRPEWSSFVPGLQVGDRLQDVFPNGPFVIRWQDVAGPQHSVDLTASVKEHKFLRPVWIAPFELKKACITVAPDGPLAIAATVVRHARRFFQGLPQIASTIAHVPSTSERQWIRNVASRGHVHLLELWALLNLMVAFFNLLPIPPLDGFRCIQLVTEALFRRRLPQKVQIALNIAGWLTMLGLSGLFFYQVIRDAVSALFLATFVA
jgi:membrane-associated protease RseP (regulator of RpoE activity)